MQNCALCDTYIFLAMPIKKKVWLEYSFLNVFETFLLQKYNLEETSHDNKINNVIWDFCLFVAMLSNVCSPSLDLVLPSRLSN